MGVRFFQNTLFARRRRVRDLYCSYLPKMFACWPSAALSSVRYLFEVRANVQIYVFPVSCLNWPKPPDSSVEAASEELRVKSYFHENLRYSPIMADGWRKVYRRSQLATVHARHFYSLFHAYEYTRSWYMLGKKRKQHPPQGGASSKHHTG